MRWAELDNVAGTPVQSKTIWPRKKGQDWHKEGGGGIQKQVKDIEMVEDEREGEKLMVRVADMGRMQTQKRQWKWATT